MFSVQVGFEIGVLGIVRLGSRLVQLGCPPRFIALGPSGDKPARRPALSLVRRPGLSPKLSQTGRITYRIDAPANVTFHCRFRTVVPDPRIVLQLPKATEMNKCQS